ncbi:MAG: methylenetetrahydrofolate reductase [NAD(P)H] [Deltaproteobacteria bacterium]|nr:methylenetetrahydrofolate reductase [NAD(P)H] [Deltaproteobacteria bacterium]
MRFSDFYNKGQFKYTVEVFPPKTEEGRRNLIGVVKKLEVIDPAYCSVTYGAMGTTREYTKDLAFEVYDQIKSHTAFHFTCVGMNKTEIKKYVDVLYQKGVDLVVALRGDWPAKEHPSQTADSLVYANELVAYLKGLHNFSIAVAGYPEKHPEAPDLKTDIINLKRKVDAGADLIITQMFFENKIFYHWLKNIRDAGITVPVIPGVMPVLKLDQIRLITQKCGTTLPDSLIARLTDCGADETAMRQVGIEHAVSQCRDLIQNGVPGIHFFCLNKSYSVLKIVEACRDLVKMDDKKNGCVH